MIGIQVGGLSIYDVTQIWCSETDGENLLTYRARFCTNVEIKRKCEKQELFIGLIPFQTIYAPLLRISKCRESPSFFNTWIIARNINPWISFKNQELNLKVDTHRL